jgi:hypothetical protein
MDFDAVLAHVCELLHRQGRVSYRALKLRFQLNDEALAALTDELIYAARVARDQDDRVLSAPRRQPRGGGISCPHHRLRRPGGAEMHG